MSDLTPAQRTRLLDRINSETSPADLRGWWLAVFTWRIRPAFDGERAALISRARSLGLNIKDA